jgi:hypothetical protein
VLAVKGMEQLNSQKSVAHATLCLCVLFNCNVSSLNYMTSDASSLHNGISLVSWGSQNIKTGVASFAQLLLYRDLKCTNLVCCYFL